MSVNEQKRQHTLKQGKESINCFTQLKKKGEKKSKLWWNINYINYVRELNAPFPHPPVQHIFICKPPPWKAWLY